MATGVIEPGNQTCVCCGEACGYVYDGPVYTAEDLQGHICPWCIADGSAASKYDATYSDARPLAMAGLAESIIDEVTRRTPGYISWQQDHWLTCCDDACEFRGDATRQDLQTFDGGGLKQVLIANEIAPEEWETIVKQYRPAGDPAVYKFICRHCQRTKFSVDYS